MATRVQAVLFIVMIEIVYSLKLPYEQHSESSPTNSQNQKSLRRILESLANAKLYLTSGDRRSIDTMQLLNTKNIFDTMSVNKMNKQNKHGLRVIVTDAAQDVTVAGDLRINANERQELVEHELQSSANKSALLHNAWIQNRGRNDFLVVEDAANDPFVTIVPNQIYYNIEKKCVNWMDDCSIQGIRARLLNRVKSPYRRK